MTGLVTGLVLGFFASFLIYLSGVLPPVGNMTAQAVEDNAAEIAAAQVRRNEELEQAAARLQLEFYKELPNYEVIVDNMPSPRQATASTAAAPAPAPAATNTVVASTAPVSQESARAGEPSFMIQAGAFQQETSAAAQSERLIALGLTARVRKEALLGKTLFLVQAGPYTSREQINQAERVLRSNGIDSIRIGLSQ
tara:strand:+ start:21951 stop:22538 length:588 start_codon:yes stop_codon:yes gene_type:complete